MDADKSTEHKDTIVDPIDETGPIELVVNNSEVPTETTAEQVAQPTPIISAPNAVPSLVKKSHKKLLLMLVLVLLILGGGGTGAFLYLSKKSSDKKKQDDAISSTITTQSTTPKPTLATTGYEWPIPAEKVSALPIFTDTDTFLKDSRDPAEGIRYYKIGSSKDATIYAIVFPAVDGPGESNQQLTVEQVGASFVVLKKHSADFFYKTAVDDVEKYYGPKLGPNTTIDETTEIADIKTPTTITYNTQKFIPSSNMARFVEGALDVNNVKVSTLPEGTLYEIVNKDEADYKITHFALLMKGGFYIGLKVDGELSKSDVEPITWSDGTKNTVDYISGAQGCGQSTSNEVAKLTIDQLKQIGTTTGGQKIYGFASNTNSLLKKHYDEYLPEKDQTYVDADYRNLTLDQYIAKPALFLVEDGLGRFLVFESSKTRFGGGCAKPVVYLYPTFPTLTHVSVGADVTLSEPFYTATGWDNVLAMPNGQLGYNGKQYESLFWEGYGHGEYPAIREGAVVTRSDAEVTMSADLKQLGLNKKESSDFMEFWTAKIPNSPYIRLTWFGTSQLDTLAPLYVSPMPDTRIRVFLDMEGLDSFVQMPAQKLSSVTRRGFTVVEWGGLARDGSVPKLR